jgi:DNA polymerase-3 subunit alpha
MTAFLIGVSDVIEKLGIAISECRRLGVTVLAPNINLSKSTFSIEGNGNKEKPAIRFGLAAIKNVGEAAIDSLIDQRNKGGPFKSIEDFCRRADSQSINKRVLESLIKAGALDDFGDRGGLLNSIDRLLSMAQTEQKLRLSGQSTMFDLFGQSSPTPMPALELSSGGATVKDKLNWEKELMGVYLSEHPFARYARNLNGQNVTLIGQITAELDGQAVVLVGMISSVRELNTRDHRVFCVATLEDLDARIEVMVWTRIYDETRNLWQEGNIVRVNGKVKIKEEQPQIVCDGVELCNLETEHNFPVSPSPDISSSIKPNGVKNGDRKPEQVKNQPATPEAASNGFRRLTITIHETGVEAKDDAFFESVMQILEESKGKDEVYMKVINQEQITSIKMNFFVDYSPDLHKRLAGMVNPDCLIVEKAVRSP